MNINDINQLVEDFTKVLTFKIVTTIKNFYHSLDEFKKEQNNKNLQTLARYCKNFHVDSSILQKLTRSKDGKRHLDEVLSSLDSSRLVYKHKFDGKLRSGKKFSKLSTFYIPYKMLDVLFQNNDVFNAKSAYYTAHQTDLIFKHVLLSKNEAAKVDELELDGIEM